MVKGVLQKGILLVFLIAAICISRSAFAETQNAISMTVPSFSPGTSGSFSASVSDGAGTAGNGTVAYTYSGQVEISLSSTAAAGRFAPSKLRYSSGNLTTMGMGYDSFLLFQSFLDVNYLTLASSNTGCPSTATEYDYNWLTIRFRTADLARSPTILTSTSFHAGGTITYDTSNVSTTGLLTGGNYFDMVGPNLTSSPTYGFNGWDSTSCSSGSIELQATGSDFPLNEWGTMYFGNHGFLYLDYTGNPLVAVGLPKQTLTTTGLPGGATNGTMALLSNDVLTGRYIYYKNYNTQDQRNIYVYPNGNGTTFTLWQANDFTNTSDQTQIGILTCTDLDSPTIGFCSGQLQLTCNALNSSSGFCSSPSNLNVINTGLSGNAVCESYEGSDQHTLVCAAQFPGNNSYPVSFIASTPTQALLGITLSGAYQAGVVQTADASTTGTVTATLTNRSGRAITIGDSSTTSTCDASSDPNWQLGTLCPPFSDSGQFAGSSSSGGACGTTLAGYGTCTVALTYTPSTGAGDGLGTTLETYRVAYSTGSGPATAPAIGAAGLTSIAVTPSTSTYTVGGSQQFTATGYYAGDSSSQPITSAVSWSVAPPVLRLLAPGDSPLGYRLGVSPSRRPWEAFRERKTRASPIV